MSDPATNEADVIVESARLSRRSEEAGRVFAQLSFPVRGNEHLLNLIASNLKNPIHLAITEVQATFDWEDEEDEDEFETVPMTVNGEDAQPVRRRRQRSSEASDDKPLAHVFKADEEDEARCAVCHLGATSEVHVATEQAAELINESRRQPGTDEEAQQQQEAEASLANRSK